MRAMTRVLLGVLGALWLAGCAEEGKPNKAQQSTTDRLMQQQQLDQERQRIQQQGQQQTLPPSTR